MRIGIMLRTLDEKGGIGVYSRNLIDELLDIDRANDYVLLYRTPTHLGRYADRGNVEERVIRGSTKAYWDQVAVPLACWREKVDLLLHPKFTVPFLAPCKTVMVVHGADWLIREQAQYYSKINVLYNRLFLPLYIRRCAVVLSVSQLTTDNFQRVLGLPDQKMITVYFGPAKHFARVTNRAGLEDVRRRYALPDQYILTLSGYDRGRRKNIDRLIEGYRLFHGRMPHKLVIGGKGCERFRNDYGIPSEGYGGDIVFPGWIDQADLPAVYTMADAFLYPSNLEAFPIPITEAMACGTPIVTSNANGLVEIAGDAAVFVDPSDPSDIADGLNRVLSDPNLREALSRRGLSRARTFSWEACARRTLEILESAAQVA